VGCGAGIVAMIGLLVFGAAIGRQASWLAVERGQRRLLAALERRDAPAERLALSRNLDRFKARLRVTRDPYPAIGRFLEQVQADLEDGKLAPDEAERINRWLESWLATGELDGAEP
jgi:hypothetical protein